MADSSKPYEESWGNMVPLDFSLKAILKTDLSPIKNFGWYWAMGKSSMNKLREYMETPAGVVRQFRVISGTVAYNAVKDGSVSIALEAFFRRMNEPTTISALDQLASLPPDIERITTLFLVHCIQSSTKDVPKIVELLRRFMKIPLVDGSIIEGSGRLFNWMERDKPIPLAHMLLTPKKSWMATPIQSDRNLSESPIEGNKSEIVITEYENAFAWQVGTRTKLFKAGFSDSLEDAAELCYKAWYELNTQLWFHVAMQPAAHKSVVLLGNELTSEEYLSNQARHWSIVVNGPDRENNLFVLNWPSLRKEKRIVEIRKVEGYKVHLTGGTKLELSDCGLFYYVHKPELWVNDEVVCFKCHQRSTISTMDMRYAQGHGPICGPCRDHMYHDTGELCDSSFD